ncbi:hypothetical protein ACFWOB_14540 [Streptomyces sp. NPDC058420]|uniref:hypothetical protein n=1 Tax=Streptomyces sp. NPDC058420 TaxID=3346489 RepID=UPI00365E86E0
MTVEPITDLRAALQQAVTELPFEAGQKAATDPERAEHAEPRRRRSRARSVS